MSRGDPAGRGHGIRRRQGRFRAHLLGPGLSALPDRAARHDEFANYGRHPGTSAGGLRYRIERVDRRSRLRLVPNQVIGNAGRMKANARVGCTGGQLHPPPSAPAAPSALAPRGGPAKTLTVPKGSKETRRLTMAETTQFTIGADVSCSDGICGQVRCVVVDPVAQEVSHLVVEAKHRQGLGRLVPLDLVDVTDGEIKLSCDLAAFEQLELGEETQFMPGSVGYRSE